MEEAEPRDSDSKCRLLLQAGALLSQSGLRGRNSSTSLAAFVRAGRVAG